MSATVLMISGTECIGDSLTKINNNFSELAKFGAPSFTEVEINTANSLVNTTNKATGSIVFDTTNKKLMVAGGPLPFDPWYCIAEAIDIVNPT
jgi:hypothetical protein